MIGEKISVAVDCKMQTVDCRLLPHGIYWLEIKIKDAFLLGLGVGVLVGLTTALYLNRKERS